MPRNSTPRATPRKSAASKQSIARGEELTRAISGNSIVDSSLRAGAPDAVSESATPAAKSGAAAATVAAADSSRQQRIAVSAYYRAEARGFAPGHELDDWLAAERELGEPAGEGVIG